MWGGAEHAVSHLLYSRFWTKVIHDAGYINFDEPFLRLKNQGMLLAYTPGREIKKDVEINADRGGKRQRRTHRKLEGAAARRAFRRAGRANGYGVG